MLPSDRTRNHVGGEDCDDPNHQIIPLKFSEMFEQGHHDQDYMEGAIQWAKHP